jgi:hypothetical protein
MHLTATHTHLLLNHVPTVGFGIGIALFAGSLWARSEDVRRASLVVLVGIALVILPTYVTGNAAAEAIAHEPDVSAALVGSHEGAALLALIFMEFTGAASWLVLWQMRRVSAVSSGSLLAVGVLAAVTMGLVARAASLGGEIRHPEIRTAAAAEGAPSLARQIGTFVSDTPWAWPAAETLHFIGLTLLVGVVLLFNLRMFGVMKRAPAAVFDRFLPWALMGLAVNVATGMLFFVAKPDQYTGNYAFYWKIWLVVAAGANALYFTVFDRSWMLEEGGAAPASSKFVAASALCLWVAVLYFGSMLPFLGDAF